MGKVELAGVLSRRLGIFLGVVVTVLLGVAAGSLLLARTISQRSERIQVENSHIRLTDAIHSAAHHLVLETNLTLLNPTRQPSDRPARRAGELRRLLAEYRASHPPKPGTVEEHEELALLGEVKTLAADLMEVTTRLLAMPGSEGRDRAATLARLETTSWAIPDRVARINALHRRRGDGLIDQSRRDLTTILGISVGVALLAALAVVGASRYAARRVTLPLQTLASAAMRIAGGDFAQRISVRSGDEIGRLAEAFNAMATQLQAHEREIQGLATVAERERLAREMHDGLAQALALVRMRLQGLDESVGRGDVPSARAIVGELRDVVGRASQEVRQAIFDLRVMVSQDLGLVPTLTEYLHDFSVESGLRVEFATHGGEFEFAPDAELQLMRILQEALANVRRHARASSVLVRLERAGDAARLTVKDDGCGFDATQPAADARPRFGLATMQERAEAAGGKFRLESRPGRGTTVEATLPLHIAGE
jgi:signal transduction histidine kinase